MAAAAPPSAPPRRGAQARCPLCPGRAGGAGQAGPGRAAVSAAPPLSAPGRGGRGESRLRHGEEAERPRPYRL